MAKQKWGDGMKPWVDGAPSDEKLKVTNTLQRMSQCEKCEDNDKSCSPCEKLSTDGDVVMQLLDAIDTSDELAEFSSELRREFGSDAESQAKYDALLTKMTSYMKATKAEMMDYMTMAMLAGCFGLAMFAAFNAYADSCAKEMEETDGAE